MSASSYEIRLNVQQRANIRTDLEGRHFKVKVGDNVIIEVDLLTARLHLIDHKGMGVRTFNNAVRRFFHLAGCKRYEVIPAKDGTIIQDKISRANTLIPWGETKTFVLPHVSIMLIMSRFQIYGSPRQLIIPWIKSYMEDRGERVTGSGEAIPF